MAHKIQTKQEELFNAVTHGIGFLLATALVPLLLTKASHSGITITIASAVFSFGFLMTYLSSTLYHSIHKPEAKKNLRIWDHISIFFLIGGTYTPIVVKYTNHQTALVFLGTMWFLIICGSALKIFFTGKYDTLSTTIYVTLGWLIVFIIKPLYTNTSFEVFMWILAGGLAYTFGVIFYKWEKLKYQHGIWHLFVLAGTLFQYVAIYKSVGIE
jgi:hemolysin III